MVSLGLCFGVVFPETFMSTITFGSSIAVWFMKKETIHDGSGKPENLNHQEEANSETFVMGSDAAEFVNKVKDQVRNKQKRMSNVAESGEEHSII